MVKMTVSAWWGGRKKGQREGGSYGVRLSKADRNKHFCWISQKWDHVLITLPNGCVAKAKIGKKNKPKFWENCPELVCSVIRDWLGETGRLSWSRDDPPKFDLIHVEDNKFRLVDQSD